MFFDQKRKPPCVQEKYYHWRWTHSHDLEGRRRFFDKLMDTRPTDSRCGHYWEEWAEEAVPHWLRKGMTSDDGERWDWGPLRTPLEAGFNEILVQALVRALGCESEPIRVRLRAAAALRRMAEKAQAAVPHLIKTMASADILVGAAAQKALESVLGATRRVIPALMNALLSPDKHVRRAAAEQLGLLAEPTPQLVEVLGACLQDEDQGVMRAAATTLGLWSGAAHAALPALQRALENRITSYDDRACLAQAILRIQRGGGH